MSTFDIVEIGAIGKWFCRVSNHELYYLEQGKREKYEEKAV